MEYTIEFETVPGFGVSDFVAQAAISEAGRSAAGAVGSLRVDRGRVPVSA